MTDHLIVAPILVPLAAAVAMLFAGDRRLGVQRSLGLASSIVLLVAAAALVARAATGAVVAYFAGDWPGPFSIVLVLDRLAAFMVALTALVALFALLAAVGGRDPVDAHGRHFHPLFQFQLMGLNGAFLTGDLFNLFVFFEVLLIASYCLLVHGQGAARLKAGVHFTLINLVASGLFLLGVAVLYGVTGTLNMAELALRVAGLAPGDVPLARTGALLLVVVFAVKAAAFPLYLWLPAAYSAASAPAAALFAVMTKVGVYAIVRVHGTIFGPGAGESALVAGPWLVAAALATAVAGVIGAVGAGSLGRMAAYLTIASVGTLLVGVSLFSPAATGAALYYSAHSTLVVAALFLLAAEVGARRGPVGDRLVPGPAVSRPLVLGGAFVVAAASVAGLPPFSGFVGKLALLEATARLPVTPVLWTVILATGFLAMLGLVRAGSVVFWSPALPAPAAEVPGGRFALVPPLALLAASVALALFAAPVQRYADAAARQLGDTRGYAARVLGDPPVSAVRPFPAGAGRGEPAR
jgi:multicomponent K+:H+ antiporter subunit D